MQHDTPIRIVDNVSYFDIQHAPRDGSLILAFTSDVKCVPLRWDRTEQAFIAQDFDGCSYGSLEEVSRIFCGFLKILGITEAETVALMEEGLRPASNVVQLDHTAHRTK